MMYGSGTWIFAVSNDNDESISLAKNFIKEECYTKDVVKIIKFNGQIAVIVR